MNQEITAGQQSGINRRDDVERGRRDLFEASEEAASNNRAGAKENILLPADTFEP